MLTIRTQTSKSETSLGPGHWSSFKALQVTPWQPGLRTTALAWRLFGPVASVRAPPSSVPYSGLEQNHKAWDQRWAPFSHFQGTVAHRGGKENWMCGCRARVMTTSSHLCPPPWRGFLVKPNLGPRGLSDQRSVGMHDTQQMWLATGVSEAPLFTPVATHEGRDAQDDGANEPLQERPPASGNCLPCCTGRARTADPHCWWVCRLSGDTQGCRRGLGCFWTLGLTHHGTGFPCIFNGQKLLSLQRGVIYADWLHLLKKHVHVTMFHHWLWWGLFSTKDSEGIQVS